ncbi:zinc finger protein 236 [Trichonephila inaurata madagascariensis]|uniref:Zinc finger protein 865 n=1 Tax=Trichonephila inaurata madagascariensis TaxID=2747483 RepID=A0A8X7BYT7_9ARAC|nr:zinc finger protein 236 [Trichonephila inaurata madagascariensis]
MDLAIASSISNDNLKFSTSEVANAVAMLQTEGMSVLSSESATSVISDPSTTQFFNLPILQDGSLPGMDTQQSYILATSADGNTILVEASQLAMLSDQSIPLYDGSNLFQIASQTVIEPSLAFNKDVDENLEALGDTLENDTDKDRTCTLMENDEILPPDRGASYKCEVCQMEFDVEKQLYRHFMKVHAEDKPNRCSQCDMSFNKKSNLLLHEAIHSKSDPTCPECHKKFARFASLKAHLIYHEVEENLVCAECGDEFSTQFKLDKHIQEHLNEQAMDQTFICRVCSKGYRKLSYLKEHMKIHTKLKASLHRRQYKRNIDRSAFSHKCYFCGKQFQKPSQLVRHNRIHTGERPFKCDMCDRAFNQKGALLIHKAKHTGERPYICEFCPAAFAQKGNLRNHVRRVHTLMTMESTEGIHRCELCTCVFRKLGSLNAHMSRTHSISSVTFMELSKHDEIYSPDMTQVMNQLMEISKENTPEENKDKLEKIAIDNNVNADILQQALENSGLASRQQQPVGSRPYVMTVADSVTGALRRHIMRNIGGVRWYQCLYCTKEFKKPSDLVRHIRIHTHEKPYKCDLCFRAFAVKSTLNAHIKTHTGAKDYSCEHCKKLFSTSGSLKIHLLLHTGAKPFACSLCSKTFRTTGHRKSHMASHQRGKIGRRSRKSTKIANISDINVANIPLQEPILITDDGLVQPVPKNSVMYTQLIQSKHASERPYSCDFCQKGFKKSSHLKQHIRSHTGEKPYKCFQCERAFVSNGVLKAHMRTHSGMKAFICSICQASFTTNGSLKRHMCIHSNDRPYMCPYCQKTFKTSMNCKKHMHTHRYELALSMASGVAVTVISDGNSNVQYPEKEISSTTDEIQTALGEIIETGETLQDDENGHQITISDSFTIDPKTSTATSVVLTQLPQHLSQDVFNTQTGEMEQAEIVTQTQEFDSSQNNLFSLTDSDFPGNHLTLQPDATSDDFVSANSALSETIIQPDASTVAQDVEYAIETTEKKNVNPIRKKRKMRKNYTCLECNKNFKKSSYLNQHILTHTGEKPFRCELCGEMFTQAKSLAQHRNEKHLKEKMFECNICTATFTAKRGLARHMNIHDINLPFHCAYCSDRYSTKEQYKSHLKEKHANVLQEETVITVPEQETIIQIPEGSVEDSLSVAHLTDTMILQSVTEKEKDKREYLPKHAHRCPHCCKSFKKPSDLIRHLRIHTGEKPYKCESCGKAFTVKSTLDSHQKTHTGEKNFSCHVCCSLFATRGSLKVHMRLHTGSRPFKCPHCELCFRTSGHRKSHVASHFREGSGRKKKNRILDTQSFEVENDPVQELESLPVVSLSEEVVNMVQPSIQLSNGNQASIQLQPNLINPGIQLTTMDSSLMSKPIQIDASLLQQLQQHFNFNITINPSLTDQLSNKTIADTNQTTQILNVDNTASTIPTNSGTFTINPNMIIHQLGFTINPQQQTELQPTENVTLIIPETSLSKNGTDELFHNPGLFDSQILTLDGSIHKDSDLLDTNKIGAQEILIGNSNVVSFADINSSLNQVTSESVHECTVCNKVFKSAALLNKHSKTHKEKSKVIYHCETCNKDFKKKNQFTKHLQTHQ